MKNAPALFPVLLAAVLAGVSFWLAYVVQHERPDYSAGNGRHDPDAIVKNFEIDHFDKTGRLQAHLNAKEMRHFPDDDTAELDEPHATYDDGQRKMVWTSDRALGHNETRQITLISNVRGVRLATETEPEQVMTTEELTVLLDDQIARTDKPVTFTQEESRIDAQGAQWDNINGVLQLQQVRSTLYKSDKK